MKIYTIQIPASKIYEFIRFCVLYNISIFITWKEENFLNEDQFFATITNQPDSKITMEEKERLINENYANKIRKTENL